MANLITLARLVLLFVTISLLYTGSLALIGLALAFTVVIFAADGLDGWVARRRGSTSQFGAIFDIAGDRVVENAYWIVFAHLGLVPIAFPLIVMTRGFAVDSLRSLDYSTGKTPFGHNTMMRSTLTRWLTGSRFMRNLYGVTKALAFCFLVGLIAAKTTPESPLATIVHAPVSLTIGWLAVYLTLVLTIVRGLPVLYDSARLWRGRR
jgi:CDP-diacylglycerol--glycerol-3-phosphate 3-phosphatidyltransferase